MLEIQCDMSSKFVNNFNMFVNKHKRYREFFSFLEKYNETFRVLFLNFPLCHAGVGDVLNFGAAHIDRSREMPSIHPGLRLSAWECVANGRFLKNFYVTRHAANPSARRPPLSCCFNCLAPGWLGDLDSNQGFPSQSRKFYR